MRDQHFYLWNTYVGASSVKANRHPSELRLLYPMGKLFVCPICSEIWLRALTDGEPSEVLSVLCDKHPTNCRYGSWSPGWVHLILGRPGSALLGYDEDWNWNLPTELLKREFLLLMEGVER